MFVILSDRVKETSTSIGTGTLDLGGAYPGFGSFVGELGNGTLTYYAITDGTSWEVGSGIVTDASPDTLSRIVMQSSNGDALVNFSVGTKEVFSTYQPPSLYTQRLQPPPLAG